MKTPECLLAYAEELEQYYARHYPPLAPLAKPCFLSTVQTTMEPLPGGETFVITGDIPAMWLRDSSAQVKNYLPFAATDPKVRELMRGVIATQARDVLLDPFFGSGTSCVQIAQIVSGSAAEQAGLKANDLILKVNDTTIDSNTTLAGVISGFNAGDTATLTIQRDGKEQTVSVTFGEYKPAEQ